MIKNFDEVKKQLGELSDVVNKFKSEQVQLKIVDLIFRNAGLDLDRDDGGDGTSEGTAKDATRTRSRMRRAKSSEAGTSSPKKKGKGNGASATLQTLLEKNFFDKKRTIGEVVKYCKNNLVRNIPMNNLSGPLGRFVRDGKLDRSKNAENQFEYIKK